MKKFYTYLHCKPDGMPFYIGKGHGNRNKDFKKGRNLHHRNIIAKYGAENILVFVFPCESEDQSLADEIQQIAQFRKEGYALVNIADGGEGPSGMKHSEETRAKIRMALTGRKNGSPSEETRRKISISHTGLRKGIKNPVHSERLKGRKQSIESVSKRTLSNTGKKRSDAAKSAMSAAQKGHPVSEEARLNMSRAHLGKKQSSETIEKRISKLRGKKRDPDICAKISAAQKGRPKNPESTAKMIATLNRPEIKAKISGENHWRAKRKLQNAAHN